MARGPVYTQEDDAKLRELSAKGVSKRAMAAVLGRTVDSVNARLFHLGLSKTVKWFWSPEDDGQLRSLSAASVPISEIATALNRTVSATRKRIFDLEIKRDGRKTRLAKRYGVEALANGKEPAILLAEIREAEAQRREAADREHSAKVKMLLDEMQLGLNAGCDRAFMFTAALVGGATLQAIGDRVGITRERVRQVIEARASRQEAAE